MVGHLSDHYMIWSVKIQICMDIHIQRQDDSIKIINKLNTVQNGEIEDGSLTAFNHSSQSSLLSLPQLQLLELFHRYTASSTHTQ